MKTTKSLMFLGGLVAAILLVIADAPTPIAISEYTEDHAYGMSFCADSNSLTHDEKTGIYSESIKTSDMFPECIFTETVPVYSLPPQEIIDNPEINQYTGEITGYTEQSFVDLDCLQEKCSQIVNLDQNTGHVISLWKKE